MAYNPNSSVQVLVEPGLQKQVRKAYPQLRPGKAGAFQRFIFTRRGQKSHIVVDSGEEDAAPHQSQLTVFHYAPKVGHLKEARIQVKGYSKLRRPLIAVTSPSIFNQPDFRSILLDNNIEVLVENPDEFQIQHLVPWITKMFRSARAPKPAAPAKTPTPPQSLSDPMDIGKRLRDPASGKLDAKKVAVFLGISLTDLATKICAVTKQNLSQSPTSAGIQEKLAVLEEIASLLSWCGSEAKLRAWLKRPNRDFAPLNGKILSPMDLILMGRAQSVAHKVHNMLLGHPS